MHTNCDNCATPNACSFHAQCLDRPMPYTPEPSDMPMVVVHSARVEPPTRDYTELLHGLDCDLEMIEAGRDTITGDTLGVIDVRNLARRMRRRIKEAQR